MYLFPLLIAIHSIVGILSFSAGVLVVLVVIFLMATSNTGEDKATAKHKVYKVRGRYFFALVICIVAGLFITLSFLPYSRFHAKADESVTVVARQWSWAMAPGNYIKKISDFTGSNEISLAAGKNILFVVTSADVNHNFAIYNSNGELLAQTQAMPQYKNELKYTFKEKGVYHILCLEYCGMAHAYMYGTIHIQ